MQSLQYATTGSQTIAVWPDNDPSFSNLSSASYDMVLVNDLGQQSTTVGLTLQNTPTSVTPRLVFSLNRSQLPSYTGNYTISILERVGTDELIWGNVDQTWGEIQAKWSDKTYGGLPQTLDIDRAWVSGSDVPTFTQYSSPDENGAYNIYHG
jgi:hypothetical protein